MSKSTLEQKQYSIRFNADTKSHLHIIDENICREKCADKLCTLFCPGEVYKWENDRMQVVMNVGVVVLDVRMKM